MFHFHSYPFVLTPSVPDALHTSRTNFTYVCAIEHRKDVQCHIRMYRRAEGINYSWTVVDHANTTFQGEELNS